MKNLKMNLTQSSVKLGGLIVFLLIFLSTSCSKDNLEVDNATYVENTLKNYRGRFTFNRDSLNHSKMFNRDSFDWYVKTYLTPKSSSKNLKTLNEIIAWIYSYTGSGAYYDSPTNSGGGSSFGCSFQINGITYQLNVSNNLAHIYSSQGFMNGTTLSNSTIVRTYSPATNYWTLTNSNGTFGNSSYGYVTYGTINGYYLYSPSLNYTDEVEIRVQRKGNQCYAKMYYLY